MRIKRPNKRILILCEGTTEFLYAKSLQRELPRNIQRSISIEIDHNSKNDPEKLAIEAKRRKTKARKERNAYESVWLFFDNDNWPQLASAFQIIRSEGFCISYSSICIEHWFILHLDDCRRSFQNGKEALDYLKSIRPSYHKTKLKHYDELRNGLRDAIGRAEIIRNTIQPDLPEHQRNPYFTVGRLIHFFRKLEVNEA